MDWFIKSLVGVMFAIFGGILLFTDNAVSTRPILGGLCFGVASCAWDLSRLLWKARHA